MYCTRPLGRIRIESPHPQIFTVCNENAYRGIGQNYLSWVSNVRENKCGIQRNEY